MTHSTASEFAHALLAGDDEKLDKMMYGTAGSIGTNKSTMSAFRGAKATKISGITESGNKATIQFSDGEGSCCVVVAEVLGQSKIGSWTAFPKG